MVIKLNEWFKIYINKIDNLVLGIWKMFDNFLILVY